MNFATLVAAQARVHGDRVALAGDHPVTYAELDRRAAGAARVLAERGVKSGDRVAIVIGNDPRFAIALLAVWRLGAVAAPLNPLLGRDDLRDILSDLSPRLVVDDVPVADGHGAIASPGGAALVLYTS